MKALLFLSLGILSYTWILYFFILSLISRFTNHLPGKAKRPLRVTALLTVHNEESLIEKRIDNLLSQDYPVDLFDILVASDGSTDKTDAIVTSFSKSNNRVKLHKNDGGGKSAAQNGAIPHATGDVVVLTDANTSFRPNTISEMVNSFSNKHVGCVSGKLFIEQKPDGIARNQGIYWKAEMALRKMESRIGSLHTCSGQVMAFRKELFKPFPAKYGDDCIIPLDIILQGYRVVHNENAIAVDTFPSSIRGELHARTRMTLRNITCTLSRYALLNPFKYPLVSTAIISHKLLRWLTPYFMLVALFANLCLIDHGGIYLILGVMQGLFYFLGFVGFILESAKLRLPVASSIFSFMLANTGFFLGVVKALKGSSITAYGNRGTCGGA